MHFKVNTWKLVVFIHIIQSFRPETLNHTDSGYELYNNIKTGRKLIIGSSIISDGKFRT